MAPTITPVAADPHSTTQALPVSVGDIKVVVTNVVWDATAYATGGLAITPIQMGFPVGVVLFSQCEQNAPAGTAVVGGLGNAVYNTSTGKLQLFNNGGQEVANATSLTGVGIQIIAFGY